MDFCPTKLRKIEQNFFKLTVGSYDRKSGSQALGALKLGRDLAPTSVELESFTLPPVWNITPYNNQIRYNGTTTYTITPGSYDTTGLVAAMTTASGGNIVLSFSTTTYLCTITGGALTALDFSFNIQTKKLARLLGFDPINYPAGPWVGVYGSQLNHRKAYLKINELNNRGSFLDFSGTSHGYTFDLTLQNDQNGLSNVMSNDNGLGIQIANFSTQEGLEVNELNYEIRDENGDIMTYMNMDWVATFKILLQ